MLPILSKKSKTCSKHSRNANARMCCCRHRHGGWQDDSFRDPGPAIASRLLEAGADVNSQDDDGMTALIWATYKGYKEIVELLINADADVNVMADDGMTALILAALKGHTEIAELLISSSAEV